MGRIGIAFIALFFLLALPGCSVQNTNLAPEAEAALDHFPETFIPDDSKCEEFFLMVLELDPAPSDIACAGAPPTPGSVSAEQTIEGQTLTIITWCDGTLEADLHYTATVDPYGTPTTISSPVKCASDGTRGVSTISFSESQVGKPVIITTSALSARAFASVSVWSAQE